MRLINIMANIILKIDVKKIDKTKLYTGEKGIYLYATIIMKDEPDQYGNNGMIVQNVSKEEREAGVKGAILGNARFLVKQQQAAPVDFNMPDAKDDLPF